MVGLLVVVVGEVEGSLRDDKYAVVAAAPAAAETPAIIAKVVLDMIGIMDERCVYSIGKRKTSRTNESPLPHGHQVRAPRRGPTRLAASRAVIPGPIRR